MKVVSSSKDKNYSLLQTKQQVNNWWYLPEEEAVPSRGGGGTPVESANSLDGLWGLSFDLLTHLITLTMMVFLILNNK